MGILAAGVKKPIYSGRRYRHETDVPKNIASGLISRGLFFSGGYSPDSLRVYHSGSAQLFTDPRWLEHCGSVVVEPLVISSAPKPSTTIARMPPTVILELIGFLQTLETMGGLGLTQKDELRVNDIKKFRKGLKWKNDDFEMEGLLFTDALNGLIQALRHSDFLEFQNRRLMLKRPVEEVASRGYAAQVSTLVDGFLRINTWEEFGETGKWLQITGNHQQGRMALILALKSLPLEGDGFYTLDDFDNEFYARVGEHLSIRGSIRRSFYRYNMTPAEIKQVEADLQAERRQKWLEQERPWVEKVLTSWLYYLGMVELGMEGKTVVSFRLTELGKAILHPEAEFATESQSTGTASKNSATEGEDENAVDGTQGTWIVQPNFDIIVYLDRTTPTQLAFLERHAERTQAQQYTAHYRLTRESVYRGLESGTSIAAFMDELALHAQAPLPQNVIVEIQEWASLREQVVLHHHAHLVEFADAAARQQALDAGIAGEGTEGRPVGDRFLLITPEVLKSRYRLSKATGTVGAVDYAKPLKQLLKIDEVGLITLEQAPTDLFLEAQLDQWAERAKKGNQWQLTQASIAKRIKSGARIDELTKLLIKRLLPRHSLPPLLQTALHNWASKRKSTVELGSVVVLRSEHPLVYDTLANSERLKPYLLGSLEEDLLAFDSTKLKEIRQILQWAGFDLEELLYW